MTSNKYTDTFKKMANEELIDAFNKEVSKPGWVSSRAEYLTALHQEFKARGFDISEIENNNKFSIRDKVHLENNKVYLTTIPKGLVKCEVCGEYKGITIEDADEGELLVQCICEGVACKKCGKKIHKPISNYFDERDCKVCHVSHFQILCSDCSH